MMDEEARSFNEHERPFSVNSVADVNIDVNDNDIEELSDYFRKSKNEIQKVLQFNYMY